MSEQDVNTRIQAMNASRLMDSIMATPAWHRSIFTDSVQLFPDNMLLEAQKDQMQRQQQQYRLSEGQGHNGNDTETSLQEILSALQVTLERTQQRLKENSAQISVSSSSASSLSMDPSKAQLFDRVIDQLMESMSAFEVTYRQELSSHVSEYYHRHGYVNGTKLEMKPEQDTIPGLGQEARELNAEQETMLGLLKSIRSLQGSVADLTEPVVTSSAATSTSSSASTTRGDIARVRKEMIRRKGENDDEDIRTMLDRLATMSATLERALERRTASTRIEA